MTDWTALTHYLSMKTLERIFHFGPFLLKDGHQENAIQIFDKMQLIEILSFQDSASLFQKREYFGWFLLQPDIIGGFLQSFVVFYMEYNHIVIKR